MSAFRIDRSLVIRVGMRTYQLHGTYLNEQGGQQTNIEHQ